MGIFSSIASVFGFNDDKAKVIETIPVSADWSSSIIDSRSITVTKQHSIIGAIDSFGNIGRYRRLVKWLEDNEVKIANAVLADDADLSRHHMALYPSFKHGALAYGPGCFSTTKQDDPVYVLGDIHGDIDSFIAMLDTIMSGSKQHGIAEPTVYLLGDIIDRNKETCTLTATLIFAILQKALPTEFAEWNSIKLGIVKGDHDVALKWNTTKNQFEAEVKPADWCDWLNARLATKDVKDKDNASAVGRAWIKLIAECPAAAFLDSSGTLLSHGGIPRSDVQELVKVGYPYIMQHPQLETDFEWCRMVDAKNKLLNRGTKTSEIGFQEFDTFNQLFFNSKIKNFIFGHQHPAKGFMRYSTNYTGYDVLCISSFRDDKTLGGPTIPYFCKVDPKEINVYSMNPSMYVVRLEENSTEMKKISIPTPTAAPSASAPTNALKALSSPNASGWNHSSSQHW